MYSNGESSFLCTAYLLFFVGKVFALSNFSIKKNPSKNRYTEVTRTDLIGLFIFLAALLFLTYENIVHPQKISTNKNDIILNFMSQLIIGGTPMVCFAAAIKVFCNREQLMKVIFDLKNIDDRVKKLGIVINHSSNYRYISIYLFACHTGFITYISLFSAYLITILKASATFYIIGCVFVNGMTVIGSNQLHLIMAVLYTRFTYLNDIIIKTFHLSDANSYKRPATSPISKLATIVEVTRIHESLNATAIKTNYLFAYLIVAVTLTSFSMTLFPMYEIYKTLLLKDLSLPLLQICMLSSSGFFNSIFFLMVLLSNATKTASNRTAVLVHKVIARESDKRIILQLKLLSQKIIHQSPTLGCAFFTLDWSFFFTYVAAAASYLVILIQFQNSFDTSGPQ